MRRLLVAVDGSEASQEALEFAVSLAHDAGMQLHVIVIRSLCLGDRPSPLLDLESARAATRIADAAVDRAAERGVHAVAHVGRGNAGPEIAEAAVRLGAAMVVLGARAVSVRGMPYSAASQPRSRCGRRFRSRSSAPRLPREGQAVP
jgi:nucleotide-binding universal stress UspA family protein